MSQKFEYHVAVYKESLISSVLLGDAKVNPDRFAEFLNEHARDGWEVVTMERESRRTLLFFSREAFIVILKREKSQSV